jgi:hypothetical protein
MKNAVAAGATLAVLLFAAWALTAQTTPPASRQDHQHHTARPGDPSLDELEMGAARTGVSLSDLLTESEGLRPFADELFAAGPNTRPVFENYLDTLGTARILDVLEAAYPLCHHQSHELGRALYARRRDLGAALQECGTRCTSGCMHGILKEAFSDSAAPEQRDALLQQMVSFCREGEIARLHKPGNCAHGIGHALLALSARDLGAALGDCRAFGQPALEYYCATGIFMEYLQPEPVEELRGRSLHYPCDTYTRYPTACYRYRASQILRALGSDWRRLAAECRQLDPALRLGCWHGLGAASIAAVSRNPLFLGELCRNAGADEQKVCIEGAVEKLADYNEPAALAACAGLRGENNAICRAAALEKMYRLDKSTLPLYLGWASVPPDPKER